MQIRKTWILGHCGKVGCLMNLKQYNHAYFRAKHDAWSSLGNLDRNTAMEKYIENLKQIVETMNYSSDVEMFMEVGINQI